MAPLICLIAAFLFFRILRLERRYFCRLANGPSCGTRYDVPAHRFRALGKAAGGLDSHGSLIDGKSRRVGHIDRHREDCNCH